MSPSDRFLPSPKEIGRRRGEVTGCRVCSCEQVLKMGKP